MAELAPTPPPQVQALASGITSLVEAYSSIGSNLDALAADPAKLISDPGAFAAVLDGAQAQLSAMSGGSSAQGVSGGSGLYGTRGAAAGSSYAAGSSTGVPTGNAVVSDAMQYLGVPYQWGGESPATGFDCSGLVQKVFANLGVSLPRTSEEQSTVGTPVASLSEAQPGDLLFFEPGPGGPGHVGIYVGNGMMIDAPHTGSSVRVEPVWTAELCGIRQVVPPTSSGSSSYTAGLQSAYGGQASYGVAAGAYGAYAPSGSMGSSGSAGAGIPASLAPLFLQAAAKYDLPPQLLASVAQVESGFNPNAVSSAGAEGLMQLMPSTAASHGVDPFDPAQAIDAAAQILAGNLQQFGSLPLALAAYNAGAGAVESYGGIPPYTQTQNYVKSVTAAMNAMGGQV